VDGVRSEGVEVITKWVPYVGIGIITFPPFSTNETDTVRRCVTEGMKKKLTWLGVYIEGTYLIELEFNATASSLIPARHIDLHVES
jgi:hypothetical protein